MPGPDSFPAGGSCNLASGRLRRHAPNHLRNQFLAAISPRCGRTFAGMSRTGFKKSLKVHLLQLVHGSSTRRQSKRPPSRRRQVRPCRVAAWSCASSLASYSTTFGTIHFTRPGRCCPVNDRGFGEVPKRAVRLRALLGCQIDQLINSSLC
jgi:hypothetical protein